MDDYVPGIITHDQMIFSINRRMPDLIHGRDYWVGQTIENGVPVDDGHIIQWSVADVPEPDTVELYEWIDADADDWAVKAAVYRLYKSTFTRRMTNEEAATVLNVIGEQEPYLQLMYNSVEYFNSNDALMSYLGLVLTDAFGAERAAELLAPEV